MADWAEDDHPRDESGKFSSAGTGSGQNRMLPKQVRALQLHAHAMIAMHKDAANELKRNKDKRTAGNKGASSTMVKTKEAAVKAQKQLAAGGHVYKGSQLAAALGIVTTKVSGRNKAPDIFDSSKRNWQAS